MRENVVDFESFIYGMEKWEQGRAKPNDQAAEISMLVRKFPDTPQRLKQLAA